METEDKRILPAIPSAIKISKALCQAKCGLEQVTWQTLTHNQMLICMLIKIYKPGAIFLDTWSDKSFIQHLPSASINNRLKLRNLLFFKGRYYFVCAERRAECKEVSCMEIFSMGLLKTKQNSMCGRFRCSALMGSNATAPWDLQFCAHPVGLCLQVSPGRLCSL